MEGFYEIKSPPDGAQRTLKWYAHSAKQPRGTSGDAVVWERPDVFIKLITLRIDYRERPDLRLGVLLPESF